MRIAIITHPLDRRLRTLLDGYVPRSRGHYQIDSILLAGRPLGLRWFHTDPTQKFRPADAALLHVDMSLVPDAYLELAARYPLTINGRVSDIRKRLVSRNLITRGSDWTGPVLAKTDLNSNGAPERFLHRRATGAPLGPPAEAAEDAYHLFDAPAAVPSGLWDDPAMVFERYLPERRGDMNVLRVWSLLGKYERCSWYLSPETVVKGRNIVDFGPSEVPAFLREERHRLGFDYGKFDFAIPPDGPVLYDANRTPATISARPELVRDEAPRMARALMAMVAAGKQP